MRVCVGRYALLSFVARHESLFLDDLVCLLPGKGGPQNAHCYIVVVLTLDSLDGSSSARQMPDSEDLGSVVFVRTAMDGFVRYQCIHVLSSAR